MKPSSGSAVYRIRVQGVIAARWEQWLDGMAITPADAPGETLLTGAIVDQAALLGLLQKLHNLGLPLLELQVVEGASPEAAPRAEEQEGQSDVRNYGDRNPGADQALRQGAGAGWPGSGGRGW
jgi:hypothetical protein